MKWKIEIRKPKGSAYIDTPHAVFGRVSTSEETRARNEREVYIDGKLEGFLIREEDGWVVDIPGLKDFFLSSLRSMRRAISEIEEALNSADWRP